MIRRKVLDYLTSEQTREIFGNGDEPVVQVTKEYDDGMKVVTYRAYTTDELFEQLKALKRTVTSTVERFTKEELDEIDYDAHDDRHFEIYVDVKELENE